jgi:hypothetical protein
MVTPGLATKYGRRQNPNRNREQTKTTSPIHGETSICDIRSERTGETGQRIPVGTRKAVTDVTMRCGYQGANGRMLFLFIDEIIALIKI